MTTDDNQSLGDAATFAGQAKPSRPSDDVSLGDERTLGGGGDAAGLDTVIDDIEVVDLEARYKVEGTLGQGGMGAVLLATDTRLDRKVAIKRILGEAAGNRMAVQRFLTEAKSIAALNHPNIVQIYDYGRAKDGPFLIMEYVDGGSLLDRCRESAIPLEEAIDLACHLCDGLAKAHDLGIVHRDIKPANVLLTRDGIPKLTDFGLAKATAGDHGQTMTGAVLGTPDFMPPEQRRDASLVDHRSDLWSLAATVYQMATGRSPKIIRFDLLPGELTKVLGKALEDAKDARYQSARELRTALKASVLAAAATAESTAGELVDGACPACGVKNDSSRRFCRGCGGSLEAPCLSCSKPMPMWEEICGSCGTKQSPLADERRRAMAAKQAEAEELLGDFEFEGATRIGEELRDEPHPKLQHLAGWAAAFLGRIEQSQAEQTARAVEMLDEAGKHESAHDYLSARLAAESIPAALQSSILPGMREPASALLERVNKKQGEARRLEELIKERVAVKQLDDLLPEVERFLAIRPDRADVLKIRDQLVDRRTRQASARDEAVVAAQASLDKHEYEQAQAVLATIAAAAVTPDVVRLRERIEGLVLQVRGLSRRIKEAAAGKAFDGLLPVVEEYLALKPDDAQAHSLRQSLVAREEKFAAGIADRITQAKSLLASCAFDNAAKLLEAIPESRRTPETQGLIDLADRLAWLRAPAIAKLKGAGAGQYAAALEAIAEYRRAIAVADLADPEFAEAMWKAEAALEQERLLRRTRFIMAATAAGIAAVIVLVGAGVWIRSSLRAAAMASAIAQSRWEDALAIEPDNVTALVGRAKQKLTANPPDVEGAFADLDRADRQPGADASAKPVRAEAHAERAAFYAKADRLDKAAEDLRAAKAADASAAALERAKSKLIQAWLRRGAAAAAKGDTGGVRTAVAAALAAGGAASSVASLRARGLVLESLEFEAKGDAAGAVEGMLSASFLDARYVEEVLREAKHASLRAAVVAAYRKAFDGAVAGKDWSEAVRVASAAERLDPGSRSWAEEAVDALPPDAIAALPPLENSLGVKLKLLPAGTFTMGTQDYGSDETPHKVTLTRPFYIGVHEVTNAQWQRVMGRVPSNRKDADRPVERVNWEEAVEFCRRLSALPAERANGRVYRLPTESEWEYACRAGTNTKYSFGEDTERLGEYEQFYRMYSGGNDEERRLGEYAWMANNARSQTHPVGQKKPNGWGLYDMHGNVWEWCSDWYGEYGKIGRTDPQGPSDGSHRVGRGGSWSNTASECRSAFRGQSPPSDRLDTVGFRLAMSPHGLSPPEADRR